MVVSGGLPIAAGRSDSERVGVLLWILSRRRIHFNKDVDCGRWGEDVEDVDVVVLPLIPPVSKV